MEGGRKKKKKTFQDWSGLPGNSSWPGNALINNNLNRLRFRESFWQRRISICLSDHLYKSDSFAYGQAFAVTPAIWIWQPTIEINLDAFSHPDQWVCTKTDGVKWRHPMVCEYPFWRLETGSIFMESSTIATKLCGLFLLKIKPDQTNDLTAPCPYWRPVIFSLFATNPGDTCRPNDTMQASGTSAWVLAWGKHQHGFRLEMWVVKWDLKPQTWQWSAGTGSWILELHKDLLPQDNYTLCGAGL